MQRKSDFSSRIVNVWRVGNDYALSAVTWDGVDTVGVCGSNPHAPTRFIELFVTVVVLSSLPSNLADSLQTHGN